jgi:hypothetical protein
MHLGIQIAMARMDKALVALQMLLAIQMSIVLMARQQEFLVMRSEILIDTNQMVDHQDLPQTPLAIQINIILMEVHLGCPATLSEI